jgi:hypothetical protein
MGAPAGYADVGSDSELTVTWAFATLAPTITAKTPITKTIQKRFILLSLEFFVRPVPLFRGAAVRELWSNSVFAVVDFILILLC